MVAPGVAHAAAVTDDGRVYIWGYGEHGRLGLGDEERRLVPTLLAPERFARARVAMVALGGKHSVAVTEGGALYAWGYGEYGRLGLADTTSRLEPTLLKASLFGSDRVAMAACGASHTTAVSDKGDLYTWGDAESAQLGHDTREPLLEPRLIQPAALGHGPVGRFRRLPAERVLAFAMLSHPRLGALSPFAGILVELLQRILEETRVWPRGRAGQVEPLVRMLGGGLLC
eukprot:Tamp_28479.p1 GENE.Tamp_28479~~Tamp_28479.p1  ORF type:complete len:262 (-),score=19.44 Tamp_28479:26-712(-)